MVAIAKVGRGCCRNSSCIPGMKSFVQSLSHNLLTSWDDVLHGDILNTIQKLQPAQSTKQNEQSLLCCTSWFAQFFLGTIHDRSGLQNCSPVLHIITNLGTVGMFQAFSLKYCHLAGPSKHAFSIAPMAVNTLHLEFQQASTLLTFWELKSWLLPQILGKIGIWRWWVFWLTWDNYHRLFILWCLCFLLLLLLQMNIF